MASELLKNRALIQRLKEPEVPVVKFNLGDTGFEELITLPEPKPQELLDIQEDVRIQRQQDTMDKARPFLMEESVDFIEREEKAIGGGLISGTDLGTREGFAGIRYNLKPLGGEGNEYIKTFETKGGEKRYLMDYSRSGFNRKFTQPFTPEGLKRVKEERDKVIEEFKSKGITEKSIKKLKNPPNPNKPWRYRQSVRGNQTINRYFATEAEAKAAQDKVLEGRAKARFVSYKDELPDIKRLLKEGKTIKQVSKKLDVPMSAIQKELGKIGKKASDFQPISYTEDPKLRKQFIDNYRKLSRSDLAKKLFPDDPAKTADSKYGKLREALTDEGLVEPKKRGELSEERLAKVKTPFEAEKQKRERRTKKLVKLGSKEYENSLTKFKTEIGRLLGIKEKKGPKISFMPLDLSHRSDIRLLSRLGDQKITPGDLGLEFTEANRRGISRYKFGVKTLERKLEPLYAQQKRLFNKVAKDGISKNLTNLIEQNNNKIDNLFRTADPVIASKLNPVLMNAETGEPFRITPIGARTLFEIGKPLEDVELGGLDDFTIKRNYANQIVQVAKEEGLLDITDKEAQQVINKYFEDAGTRAPIKTVKRTIAGQIQEIPRGTEGFVPDADLLRKELIPTEEAGQKKLTALQQLASGKNVGFDPILATRAGFEEFVKPAAKIGLRGAAGLADLALSAGAGPIGLGVGALIETGQAMPELTRGNIKEAGRRTIIGSLLPESLVGSMRGDLLKLAETPEEKIAMQNFIDFEKDREKYETNVKNLRYLEENPFEAEGIDLSILQNKVLEQRADLEDRVPKVFFPEFAEEIYPTLVRRLDAQNVENLEGPLGFFVGRRGIDRRDKIIQEIGEQGLSGQEPFYGQAPVQVSPEELDEIYESGIMAMANGGRIGFADGPDDPSKRAFMKIMAGIASLPILGKFFKSANVAKKVVPLTNTTTTMPEWFPQFVEKALAKGVQTKVDADLIEVKIPELPDVKMEVRTDGKVYVEGKNAYNEPYQIEYEPPGYEVLDYETGKTVKTKGDFQATDTEYRMVGEDDYDVDGVVLDDVDEVLGGSATKLEGFAKGTGKEKYTIGQKRIDEAEALGERADENIPYKDMDPTDFADE